MVYSLGPKAPNSHKLPMVPHVYSSTFLFTPIAAMDTVNLHNLSTIHLCEHLLSKLHFKHLHLYEINDGSASQTILKDTPLPVLDNLPKNILHLAFFLVENDSEIPQIMNPANAIPTSGNYVTSVMELEMYFWSISH